jgi:hypothetical protein
MMFQLVSFLKLRRCMTVILPFCVHTHLMQSPPFVKGAAPKSSSATQWVLMRGLIFFTTCCNLDFFCQGKNHPRRNQGWGQLASSISLNITLLDFGFYFFRMPTAPRCRCQKKKREHPKEEKVKAW